MHSLIGTVNAALLLAALAAPVLGAEAPRVAVYSHTAAYRHESIEAGVRMLEALGATHGFGVEHGEDPAWFEAQDLAQYSAIVWLNTSGDALTPNGKAAFAAPEAVNSSIVVIICVAFLMAYLAGADWFLGRLATQVLIGRG
jgi:hypothetical protein